MVEIGDTFLASVDQEIHTLLLGFFSWSQMAEEQTLPEGSGVRDLSSAEVARDATRDMSAQQVRCCSKAR